MANLEEQMDPVWGSKKKKKKTRSPHFQFSTLMNHNQIIHKLPPQFQTNRMAGKHVWRRVLGLFGEETASWRAGTASIWSACHWKLHYKNLPEVLSASFTKPSLCLSVSPCVWPCLIRVSGEICVGEEDFPHRGYIWITDWDADRDGRVQIHTEEKHTKRRQTPSCTYPSSPIPSPTRLIPYHITSLQHLLEFSDSWCVIPPAHFLSHLKMSWGRAC